MEGIRKIVKGLGSGINFGYLFSWLIQKLFILSECELMTKRSFSF